MADLTSVVGNLEKLGFYDFVLPWLLFFALIFGILNKVEVLGKDKKINSIIAAVIAFFIVNFTPVGGISAYYSTLFGVWGMVGGVLLVLVLFIGVLGYKPGDLTDVKGKDDKQKYPWAKPLIGLVLVVFAYLVYMQAVGVAAALTLSGDTLTLIFVGIFILLVLWFAVSGGNEEPKQQPVQQSPARR